MGEGVDKIEIKDLVKPSRVLKHQGFVIEVVKNGEVFILFLHIHRFVQAW
jgi:hypothetical protein